MPLFRRGVRHPEMSEFRRVASAEVAFVPLSPSLWWYVVSTMRAERIREAHSRRSDMDSAPEAWPSEVRSFLGPIQDSPPTGVPSRGSSASTAAVSAQGVREALPAHPPPGAILQPGVPCGGTPVAAKASQPAVPHNGQWPRETPVPEPPVPMSLRQHDARLKPRLTIP